MSRFINPSIVEAIKLFPAEFGLRGFPGDVFRMSPEASYLSDRGLPILYTERRNADGSWSAFAKGCVAEMRSQVVAL